MSWPASRSTDETTAPCTDSSEPRRSRVPPPAARRDDHRARRRRPPRRTPRIGSSPASNGVSERVRTDHLGTVGAGERARPGAAARPSGALDSRPVARSSVSAERAGARVVDVDELVFEQTLVQDRETARDHEPARREHRIADLVGPALGGQSALDHREGTLGRRRRRSSRQREPGAQAMVTAGVVELGRDVDDGSFPLAPRSSWWSRTSRSPLRSPNKTRSGHT